MDAVAEQPCLDILKEIQVTWDEIGMPTSERREKLRKLQIDCQMLYSKLLKEVCDYKKNLKQSSLSLENEIINLYSILGEKDTKVDSLPLELFDRVIQLSNVLEELRKRKEERIQEFHSVKEKLEIIIFELTGTRKSEWRREVDSDLSLNKLQSLYSQLETLRKEKEKRIGIILNEMNTIRDLCLVMGTDLRTYFENLNVFLDATSPDWSNLNLENQNENINVQDSIIPSLKEAIQQLRVEKRQRMEKMSDLGASLVTLWDLLETPEEEQHPFEGVSKNIAVSMANLNQPGILSLESIQAAEKEVEKLLVEKTKKMKELVLKKRIKLEEICSKSHLIPPSDTAPETTNPLLESGATDADTILEQIDAQIARLTEEDLSRRDILNLVERWKKCCEAENWLEEFEKDENRYGGQRGRHVELKQAESSREKIKKIPQIIKSILSKVETWETERGKTFLYDGAVLSDVMREDSMERSKKEEEKKRRMEMKIEERKKLAEEEAMFGSMPRTLIKSNRKNPNLPTASANRRHSFGPTSNQDPTPTRVAGALRVREAPASTSKREKAKPTAPANVVALNRQGGANEAAVLPGRSPLSNLDPVSPALNIPADPSIAAKTALDPSDAIVPKRLDSQFCT